MGDDKSEFRTPDELQDLLEWIGLRLHAKNRIAGGESGFYWHLAEVLRATGRLAAAASKDTELEARFVSDHPPGAVSQTDGLVHFLALLKDEMAQM